eukprot:CAMPEP_0119105778 /NCGR_PEP_ID=MMETSP1180-20130426/3646_1 /TAXON_ID=3052 ORGANISM="Chlamydomonas cf sp, Strain CCMP681" /NCGR_SAMPLE_ID=MMETSP1180 /ASSEMBLY_ACC=CAM_ASM_000741 /LENGTH=223 /DNA_ID=CAMNT_0007090921 /DNA_START=88 /DNA_END=759 /DNA_ORIENTATION=-
MLANRFGLSHCRARAGFASTHSRRVGFAADQACLQSRLPQLAAQSHANTGAALAAEPWINGVFIEHMAVRDSELDMFGVVNHAIHASYLQHARHEALASLGFQCDETALTGSALALSELTMQYKAPLRSRDRFRVSVEVDKLSGARVVLRQRIHLIQPGPVGSSQGVKATPAHPVLVTEALATVVWLNAKYQPTRIPADVKAALNGMLQLRTGSVDHDGQLIL